MFKKLFYRAAKAKETNFTGFGVFSKIHCYFREKYRTALDHRDFYLCAHHFFKALFAVLEGADFKEPAPEGAKHYAALYADLCASSPFDAEVVIEYLRNLSNRAKESTELADVSEITFYQRFLAKESLPLLFSHHLSEAHFNEIIERAPGEIFLDEQEISRAEKTTLLFSNLLLQLSESKCENANERYIKIVSCFPKEDSRTYDYLITVEILKNILKSEKKEIIDRRLAPIIFQALLLSVRKQDQEKANLALRQHVEDSVLVSETLCDASFLHILGKKSLCGGRFGNSAHVEKLFVYCVWPGGNQQNMQIVERLNQSFSSYAEEHDNEPLLHIATSSQEGMCFFGMINPKIAGSVYTQERLLSLLHKLEKRDFSSLEDKVKEMILIKQKIRMALMSFLLHVLHKENIAQYCETLFEENDEKIANTLMKRIQAYSDSRLKLYPDSDVMRQLRFLISKVD